MTAEPQPVGTSPADPARSVMVAGTPVPTAHLIAGEWVHNGATFADHSPIDGALLADVARGDVGIARGAVAAAEAAFPAWAALGPTGRAPYLHRLADLVEANIERIAAVECLDMAMLADSLRLRVIARGARNLRAYADLAVEYEPRRWSSNGTANTVLRQPAGPAAIITPWNAPFMLATWKVAPALAAGNPVVLKPAEWSPLSAALLAELSLEAGLPPGVFNLVQGIGEEVGAALVADARLRRISFTGSPDAARAIGRSAATNLVPFTAELGGKNPFIVLADADLDLAARLAARQYDDGGQVCLSGTRLIVDESVVDEFVERFRAATEAHVLGDPRDERTTISPLIHPEHLARVSGFVERARAAGDRVIWGGRVWRDGGLWYEPTLIEPRSNDAEVVQHEVFGPVLTLQTVSGESEALALANSTPYGLSGVVLTEDPARAERVGAAVRSGTVWVNCYLVRDLSAPFGGRGISGIGREGGEHALDFHSDLQTLQIAERP